MSEALVVLEQYDASWPKKFEIEKAHSLEIAGQ